MDISPEKNPELFSPESQASVVIGVATFLMTVATTAVALRLYTRKIVIDCLGIDDYLVFCALVFALATGVGECIMTRYGLGRHIGTLPQPDGFENYMFHFYLVIIWYNSSILMVKLTFLTQYYRILGTTKMKTACIVAMVIIGAWSTVQLLLAIFMCNPVPGFWNFSLHAYCLPTLPEWYQNASGNIVSDVVIFCLPLPCVVHLNLPRKQKIVLLGIFCLGFFTCAISIIRIKYLHLYTDATWNNVQAALWSLCEVCSGTVCCSLPTLRPLVKRWLPTLTSQQVQSSPPGYSENIHSSHRRSGAPGDLERGLRCPYHSSPTESENELIYRSSQQHGSRGSASDQFANGPDAVTELSYLTSDGLPQIQLKVPSEFKINLDGSGSDAETESKQEPYPYDEQPPKIHLQEPPRLRLNRDRPSPTLDTQMEARTLLVRSDWHPMPVIGGHGDIPIDGAGAD